MSLGCAAYPGNACPRPGRRQRPRRARRSAMLHPSESLDPPDPDRRLEVAAMMKNIGGIDRLLRAIGGVIAISLGLYLKTWWGLIGVPLLLTAAIGWCPAYLPFRFSTRDTKPGPR